MTSILSTIESKQFIEVAARTSDWYVTMTRTGGAGPSGVTALAIDKSCPGLTFGGNERKMGWNAQPTRQVIFENCHVPVANRLGEEGEGFRIAMKGLDGGRLNIAACSIGGAQSALDRSLAYMAQRKAFGRTIDQFQALQFRLADMAIQLEAARALLQKAARQLDANDPEATRLVAMAKMLCHRDRLSSCRRGSSASRGLWIPRGVWDRKDSARSEGAPNSRGDERSDAYDHRT